MIVCQWYVACVANFSLRQRLCSTGTADLKATDDSENPRNRVNINDDAGQDQRAVNRASQHHRIRSDLSGDALRVSVMTSNVGTPRYDMIVIVTTHR